MSRNSFILDRMRLDGKVALVTGGARGIGAGFCHALGEAGAKVAVVDCDEQSAVMLSEVLSQKGIISIPVIVDVTVQDDVVRMIKSIVSEWGELNIAVNNAGIGRNTPAEDIDEAEWNDIFRTNLYSVLLCAQQEAKVMFPNGYGKIINTASMSSVIIPHPQKQATYNTSKAGVVQLTKSLACEWADRGIRVNAISPGIVQTPMIETKELKPLVADWLSQIPLGRLAQISDLQGAIVYLASSLSDYMTGHNLIIDGGQTLW